MQAKLANVGADSLMPPSVLQVMPAWPRTLVANMARGIAINAACFLLGFNAMAQSADLPRFSEFRVGESWSFSMLIKKGGSSLNLGEKKYVVEKVEGNNLLFDDSSLNFESLYLYGNNLATDLAATDEKGRKGAWRVWPLVVGSTWRFMSIGYMPTLQSRVVIQDVTVAGYEDVKVAAGTFKAFRIEHRGTFCIGCFSIPRDKVIPTQTKLEKVANDTYWYSPEARMDIKKIEIRDDREFTMELSQHERPR